MRAREFTINVPINIKINDDNVEIETDDVEDDCEQVGDFVPPLQQKLELAKASLGKNSKVIHDLLADDETIDDL